MVTLQDQCWTTTEAKCMKISSKYPGFSGARRLVVMVIWMITAHEAHRQCLGQILGLLLNRFGIRDLKEDLSDTLRGCIDYTVQEVKVGEPTARH